MVTSILGCGWFGLDFGERLVKAGHEVKGSTTSAEKLPMLISKGIDPFVINLPNDSPLIDPVFFRCDALVLTIPPKLTKRPVDEYLSVVNKVIEHVRTYHIEHVVFISSTSVYDDVNDRVDENTLPSPTTASGKAVLQAETLFRSEDTFTTTIVRFAGLIGPGRDPANFFAGKKNIPNGQAPVNLIHLEDCSGFCLAILEKNAFGHTLNACSPRHPRRMDFYVQSAIRAGVAIPDFMDELKQWKIVGTNFASLLDYRYRSELLDLI